VTKIRKSWCAFDELLIELTIDMELLKIRSQIFQEGYSFAQPWNWKEQKQKKGWHYCQPFLFEWSTNYFFFLAAFLVAFLAAFFAFFAIAFFVLGEKFI
jgi:hypothetical protein